MRLVAGLVVLAGIAPGGPARADAQGDDVEEKVLATYCAKGATLAGTYEGTLTATDSATWDADGIPRCFEDAKTLDYVVTVTDGKKPKVTPIRAGTKVSEIERVKLNPPTCEARGNRRARPVGMTWLETWEEAWKQPDQKMQWEARAGFFKLPDGTVRFRLDAQLYVRGKMICYALFE